MPIGAAAQTTSDQTVAFNAVQELFRGDEASAALPTGITDVTIQFTADVVDTIELDLTGTSNTSWPDAITQQWAGTTGGGETKLTTEVSAGIVLDVALWGGFQYTIWDDSMTWVGEETFDSFLLPGGAPATIRTAVDATDLLALDTDFEFTVAGETIEVDLYGDVAPTSHVDLTGLRITTDGNAVETHDGSTLLDAPTSNTGSMSLQSIWEGQSDAEIGLVLTPSITVSVIAGSFSGASFQFDYPYTFDIGTDSRVLQTKATAYEHDLPAVDVMASIDFGNVEVGDSVSQDLDIRNLGAIVLTGTSAASGDASFGFDADAVDVTTGTPQTMTVSFSPEGLGDLTGTVTLTTNDPANPEVTVALTGTGVEEGMGDDTGPGDDPGQGSQSGCGCSGSGPAPVGLTMTGLLGLLLLRRRR